MQSVRVLHSYIDSVYVQTMSWQGGDPEFLNRGPKCAKAHSDRAGGG